jgi:hypothetical protein
MQYSRGYPIGDLLDFLDPTFPARVNRRQGFGRSVLIPLDKDGTAAVQQEFRQYLEEWIQTGFQPDGSEWPEQRNFAPPQSAESFSGNLFPRALESLARFWNGELRVKTDKSAGWSYLIVPSQKANADSESTAGLSVEIGSQGGFGYQPSISRRRAYPAIETEQTTQPRLNIADRSNYVPEAINPEPIAACLFESFYRSEWLFRLMQCHHCRSFAVPNKLRKSYVRGWHCRNCSSKVTAIKATGESRKQQRDNWLKLAVDACALWNAMGRKPRGIDRVQWITVQVNEKLALVNRIKRQRITRNLSEIEKLVRERNHAES